MIDELVKYDMLNNLFKCSAQDSNLEYLCWRSKNLPLSSDIQDPTIRFNAA